MRIVEGLKWYYELCGSRGVCEIALFRFFGRPQTLAVVPPLTNHPVHLRIGTSDFCSYRDVLVFQTKSYDPKTICFVPKTIVDVGAHIGMASIRLALDYPMAIIFAVEPEPSNFAALSRNVLPYKNIVPIHAALWPVEGRVSMEPSNAHPKGTFRVVQDDQPYIRAITMDTLMRENGIDSIDLLKMDIEGAEKDVFKECPWIRKVRVLAIELHDRIREGCRETVLAAAAGFDCHERGEITFLSAANRDSPSETDRPATLSAPLRSSTL